MSELPGDAVGVGLVGLGTIGTGTARILLEHAELIRERLGHPLELVRIADLDLGSDRGIDLSGFDCSSDWRDVIGDPRVGLVVELVGGTGVAREIVIAALEAGKGVVTANKALLAHHGFEIYETAARCGIEIGFEASVAGTIPVLRALREGLCADRLEQVFGIVNGTCNYILSEMDEHGEPYESCLKRAQDLGYAEADPSFDVDGTDSAHKLAILCGLAFGVQIGPEEIATEGIEKISAVDIDYARRFGFRIKLLAIAKRSEAGLEARVHPTLLPCESMLERTGGAMNAVEVRGQKSGPTVYYGAGAGADPTASAVVADLMELARSRKLGPAAGGVRVPPLGTPTLRALPVRRLEDLEGEFYLRFDALDRPGVLAHLAGALGDRDIGIASLLQLEERRSEAVPVVLLTHRVKEAALRAALAEVARLGDICSTPRLLRIEREL